MNGSKKTHVLMAALLLGACYPAGQSPKGEAGSPTPAAKRPPKPWKAAAIAHGGASNPAKNSDGPRRAVDAALAALAAGADPVDAAVAGVVVLEDDPRFNAGTGSRVRLDGETVQMDASLMASDGRFAAIGVIERVKNPVKVARALLDTPHLFLAGDGATDFARTLGMPDYDPATEEMKAKTREIQRRLLANDPTLPERWRTFDWRTHWNFAKPIEEAFAGIEAATLTPEPARTAAPRPAATATAAPVPPAATAAATATATAPTTTPIAPTAAPAATETPAPATAAAGGGETPPDPAMTPGTDTVGVAVRTADGRFAVALSTGGTSITLHGRIGDVPVYGAGLWAGPHGAIAATGTGERIIEQGLAREMHRWLESGMSADAAARKAVELIREKGSIGVIVIDPVSMSAAVDKEMAWAAREEGSTTWLGPEPGTHTP